MTPGTPQPAWPKSIPPKRDRLQSRLLIVAAVPLLCAFAASLLATQCIGPPPSLGGYPLIALDVSIAFALLAWRLRAATPAAAVTGGLICLLLSDSPTTSTFSLLHSGLPPLVLLFIFTFLATRYHRAAKEAHGLAEARTGRRASQVIANLGIAAVAAPLGWHLAAIAAIAEATADTLSSEIGQAVAGPVFLITTLRRVPPGTDGGLSLVGTLAGLVGAAAVTLTGLPQTPHKFLHSAAIFAAATAGLLFDSLLGATLERRGYLGNDLVNFASTAFAAATIILLGPHLI